MITYALCIGLIVQSHFTTTKPPEAFPDIATQLVVAPHTVQDGARCGTWDFPVVVPQQVTRRQAKQALLLFGITPAMVQAAIDAIPDETQRALMQFEWSDSQEFVRTRPTLIAMGYAMGLSDAQIDALFIAAAKL